MADGSISFVEGLGYKAQDSNELRRKQKLASENHEDTIPVKLQTHLSQSPKSGKNSSPSRKLQQAFMEVGLKLDAEEKGARDLTGSGSLIINSSSPSSSDRIGVQSPTSNRNPNSAQQLFEDGLIKEAEAREKVTHVHGNTYQVQRTPSKVHKSNPNPSILVNALGTPYVEGDPNLGYSSADIKPRYPADRTNSKPRYPSNQQNQSMSKVQPHQPHNTKAINGQNKPKPKNWASLLQSQSPSLDMTLDFFPDLQRGKEALVEIDLELTEVGKWNRYLVGHFLDGKMAYPLLFSTARNQWKELFVAVKPDIAGFYLFEFRDEQAKQQVLEGGPYFFSQKYLVLKDWHRMLKPAQEQPSKIPAWVKFHDLPFELWNKECLSRIASTIERPLHVDQATAKSAKQSGLIHTKTSKARICIEVNAEHDLPEEVTIVVEGESVIIPVEYQVLPPMCNVCHVFRHSIAHCAKKASSSSSISKHAAQSEIPVGIGSSSLPQQQSKQEWVQVRNGKQKAVQNLSNQRETETFLPIPCISRDLHNLSEDTSASFEQVQSDSEEELLEVLEKVVNSVNEAQLVKVADPMKDGSLHQITCSDPGINTAKEEVVSISSTPKARQPNPEPPDIPSARVKVNSSVAKHHLSKSTQKKLRKQVKEQTLGSLSRGGK